jgi:thiamine biosynthesis lipoprotein
VGGFFSPPTVIHSQPKAEAFWLFPLDAQTVSSMHRFTHAAMAAQFEIRCTHRDEKYARQAANFAFSIVDQLEQKLSRFVENSDISRVNHLSAEEHTVVSYETMQCLQLARFLHVETGGTFDVSTGKGLESLEIIPGEFLVCAHANGVLLDMGAIGKGYAVDRVAEVLEDWEVDQALISAGYSTVLALKPPSGCEDWPLTISMPGKANGAILANIAARQRALGASGIRKPGHILDPRTGKPVHSRQAAWVSASRQVLVDISRPVEVESSPAAVADALSTAFMIMLPEEIKQCCCRHPGLEAWILQPHLMHFVNQ